MQYYFAPLEGITGYIYRNAFRQYFDGEVECEDKESGFVDKYFAPFISPGNHKKLTGKEQKDVAPEHNVNINLVPQILTNDATCFVRTVKHLEDLGYREVNLNLGCPSGTVVAKHKGAGFLEDPDRLDAFFDQVFPQCELALSVKTRIGLEETWEFQDLMKVFNRYPFSELIIHPRLRKDFYKNTPDLEQFTYALDNANTSVCYNGDIFTVEDYQQFCQQFPMVDKIMLGRGVLANPGLFRQLQGGNAITKQEFKAFHDVIFGAYEVEMSGDRNLLFKMKELWNYWICMFPEATKNLKKIRKSGTKAEYISVVQQLLSQYELNTSAGYAIY